MKISFDKYKKQFGIGITFTWHEGHKDLIVDFMWWYMEISTEKDA